MPPNNSFRQCSVTNCSSYANAQTIVLIVLLAILTTALVLTGWFVVSNINYALTSAESIQNTRTQVGNNKELNFGLLEKTRADWAIRMAPITAPTSSRHIFEYQDQIVIPAKVYPVL
jgi:hypothetical protein